MPASLPPWIKKPSEKHLWVPPAVAARQWFHKSPEHVIRLCKRGDYSGVYETYFDGQRWWIKLPKRLPEYEKATRLKLRKRKATRKAQERNRRERMTDEQRRAANSYGRDWRQRNPELVVEHHHRRRARKGAQTFTASEWKELRGLYGNRCLKCGATENIEPDHVIPLSRGGANTISNIQPLCRRCNRRKHARTADYRPKVASK